MIFPYEQDIQLEDPRVRIEPLSRLHLDALEPIVHDNPGLLRYSPSVLSDREDLLNYIEHHTKMRQERTKYAFAIFDKEQQAYAGSTSYMHISEPNAHLEIGSTWIGKRFQRTGLNRHMKFQMLRYAFEELGVVRVAFRTDARNEQSRTAIQAIGATYEGTLRRHIRMPDGYIRDTVCYSILAEEWPRIRTAVFQKIGV